MLEEWFRAWLGRVGVMKIAMKRVGWGQSWAWVKVMCQKEFSSSIGLWSVQRSCSVTACGHLCRFGNFTVERTHNSSRAYTLDSLSHMHSNL